MNLTQFSHLTGAFTSCLVVSAARRPENGRPIEVTKEAEMLRELAAVPLTCMVFRNSTAHRHGP